MRKLAAKCIGTILSSLFQNTCLEHKNGWMPNECIEFCCQRGAAFTAKFPASR